MDDDDDDDEEDNDTDDNNNHQNNQTKRQFQNAMFGTTIFGTQKLTKTEFTKRLWGNTYYNPTSKKFTKKSTSSNNQRTFCTFILEPLYKLYGLCLGEKEKDINKVLRSFGIYLTKDQLRSDVNVLLNIVMRKFFGDGRSFVDAVVKNV